VNALHDRRATEDATKSSLVGPFYRQDSPSLKLGDTIVTKPTNGKEVCLYGRVTDSAGRGIANAAVEVWQPDETGNYDLQMHDPSEMDLRGTFQTDSDGVFYLRTIVPLGYMVPMDGPVGGLIRAQKRHGYRPAHIHFIIAAPGYREVVTALYLEGDPHIDSDTVFGVTSSLITGVNEKDPASPIPGLPSIKFNFELPTAQGIGSGRVGADPSQITKRAAG